jgi:lipopolysaccharide biosynthesis regulator YciM
MTILVPIIAIVGFFVGMGVEHKALTKEKAISRKYKKKIDMDTKKLSQLKVKPKHITRINGVAVSNLED